jgi:hypothetical protein
MDHRSHGTHIDILPVTADAMPNNTTHQSSFIDKMFGWAGAISVGIAATPIALRQIGIGVEHMALDEDARCCKIIQNITNGNALLEHEGWNRNLDGGTSNTYGIGGWTAGLFSHVPFGEQMFAIEKNLVKHMEALPFVQEGSHTQLDPNVHPLARGGIMNALVAGGVILVGHFGGHAIDHVLRERAVAQAREEGASADKLKQLASERTLAGRIIQDGSKLVGASVLLPAILPGVGHALLLLSNTAGIDNYKDVGNTTVGQGPATLLATILGKNPGNCKGVTKMTDTVGGTLLSQLCCVIPAFTAAIPGLLNHGLNSGNITVHLPEGITPYDAKHHSKEPDIEALTALPENILEQRLRSNQYHIHDTIAAQEANKGVRNTIKLGSALASTFGTVALGNYLIKQQASSEELTFDEKVNAFRSTPSTSAQNHDITIDAIQKPHASGEMEPLKARFENYEPGGRPDHISFQFGSSCCPGEKWFPAKTTEDLIASAKQVITNVHPNTVNQYAFSGGVASLAGVGGYKLAEYFIDKPAARKIDMLEKENSAIETILESRKVYSQANHSERILNEKEQKLSVVDKGIAA